MFDNYKVINITLHRLVIITALSCVYLNCIVDTDSCVVLNAYIQASTTHTYTNSIKHETYNIDHVHNTLEYMALY
jgi:hypothetical protein